MSLGTLFAAATTVAIVMQSFVLGTVRYTPSDRPVSFWVGVGLFSLLAASFYFLALRGRRNTR